MYIIFTGINISIHQNQEQIKQFFGTIRRIIIFGMFIYILRDK